MTNSKELFQEVLSKITLADREEAAAIVYFLLEQRLGLSRSQIMSGKTISNIPALSHDIDRINRHEPVQYITECAWFRNRLFAVKAGVLIPRPETEVLVDEVIREAHNPESKILDVGVGSGCISVSLALALPKAVVLGIDISDVALSVAQENAKRFKVTVQLHKKNILSEELPSDLDIIVSNPPYVREQEKKEMDPNVLNYEPAEALFVSDADPLVFYRVLGERGKESLKPGGKLLVELNAALAIETMELIRSLGYQHVQLIKDLEGKNRILKAIR